MAEALLLAACLAGYAGFGLLAVSMARHWRELAGDAALPPARCRALRRVGALAIAGSFALVLWRDGGGFGSLLGILLLSACATAVAFTLSARPRWLTGFAERLAERSR
ncbi:DUF3325 family protein [Denitromonas iodatirespirans]|uniref:DUF3325 family protein n=1 Tax=Denitromonas iodatirespirans TaxID=2795389 RepID=A0A944D6G9_DENI1|nr:DUF3325 family protein [Denitromonas iodatirespirans]MBT0960824.1 DUF3325 family protein [Denitromonas iodatirespirans]